MNEKPMHKMRSPSEIIATRRLESKYLQQKHESNVSTCGIANGRCNALHNKCLSIQTRSKARCTAYLMRQAGTLTFSPEASSNISPVPTSFCESIPSYMESKNSFDCQIDADLQLTDMLAAIPCLSPERVAIRPLEIFRDGTGHSAVQTFTPLQLLHVDMTGIILRRMRCTTVLKEGTLLAASELRTSAFASCFA
eukprot:6379339-Amphidinium_carterae.1